MNAIVAALVLGWACTGAMATVNGPRTADPLRLGRAARVVVVAPHPDDETIAAGGLIHRLARERQLLHVIFVTSALSQVLRAARPTVIVLPHPDDVHPDHAATARFVVEAADRLRGQHVLRQDVELLAYLVHDPLWPPATAETPALPAPTRLHDTQWIALPLSPEEQAAKAGALRAYASQLAWMPDLLHRFLRSNELFGRVGAGVLARIAGRHEEAVAA